ncbi:hypothetical protein I79_014997 [Cricetulus griseus]|nr:hypothetical protein I79_014997 [Cricetulus griseus]
MTVKHQILPKEQWTKYEELEEVSYVYQSDTQDAVSEAEKHTHWGSTFVFSKSHHINSISAAK